MELVDERASARQDPSKDQSLIWRFGRPITARLKGDRRRQVEEDGAEVDTIIGSDPPLHREDWHRLKGWYQAAVNHTPPPALVTLERITSERVNLYSYITPLGENIPISVEPFLVDDSVPTEEEIDWAVPRLRNNGSGVPSGMRAEHLKWWLAVARNNEREEAVVEQEFRRKGGQQQYPKGRGGGEGPEDSTEKTPTEASNWERVVDLVQTAFREGRLAEESMW